MYRNCLCSVCERQYVLWMRSKGELAEVSCPRCGNMGLEEIQKDAFVVSGGGGGG